MKDNTKPRFYKIGNYAMEAAHIVALGALAIGAGEWAGFHAMMWGAGGAAALTIASVTIADYLLPKIFLKRPIVGAINERLVAPIKAFSKKIKLTKLPEVYDFELNPEYLKKDDPVAANPQTKRIINAAATGLKKPALILSTAVLQLLKPDETKAVLAHEFTHLGARHLLMGLVTNFLRMTTMFTAGLGFGNAVLSQGWKIGLLSIAGSIVLNQLGNKFLPSKKDRYTRDGELKPRTQWVAAGTQAAQEIFTLGLMAIPNPPVILTAAAIEHGFFWTSGLVAKSYSRRHEFQADRGAVELGANPLNLVTSLRKLSEVTVRDEPELALSLDWRRGSPVARAGKMACSIYKTHPDIMRRCNRLAKLAAGQGRSVEEIAMAMHGKLDLSGLSPVKKGAAGSIPNMIENELKHHNHQDAMRQLRDIVTKPSQEEALEFNCV